MPNISYCVYKRILSICLLTASRHQLCIQLNNSKAYKKIKVKQAFQQQYGNANQTGEAFRYTWFIVTISRRLELNIPNGMRDGDR